LVLAIPGMVEGRHMGHADFRLQDRVVASLSGDEAFGVVRVEPEVQAALARGHPGQFEPMAGAWGARGWTRVVLEAAREGPVREALKMMLDCAEKTPGRSRPRGGR
jgi:hypothetical protein